MQINSNYSMNGVLYETRRKQDNIPQFSTECVVQENENINPYMEEVDSVSYTHLRAHET